MLETLIAAIMLASLILYALMGGADYGVECGIYLPVDQGHSVNGTRLLKRSLPSGRQIMSG